MALTWDFITTIAVTAFVTGSFNALANYLIYKLLIKHLDKIEDKMNGQKGKGVKYERTNR